MPIVTGFNPAQYLAANPDLVTAGYNESNVKQHFDTWGQAEYQMDPTKYAARSAGVTFGVPLDEQLANNAQNPVLPMNTEIVPQTMQVQQGELVNYNPITTNTNISPAQAVAAPTLNTAQASTANIFVDPNTGQQYFQDPTTGTYTAMTTDALGGAAQMQAQQAVVSNLSTMVGQLTKLYSETQDGVIAEWAQGAVRIANDVMTSRGMANSSIGIGAITEAIQQSAMHIAERDANTYFQMDMANLNNRQQAALVNTQQRQQALLSDQAAINAAKQFNAASSAQVSQFQAQLVASITSQNAERLSALEQFNTAALNSMELAGAQLGVQVGLFNEQQRSAVEQYNNNMNFQRDTFNSTMQVQIDQANAQWRRSINTANTATINAANQLNAQNAFNLSSYSLNALWQTARDEANFAFTASQNAMERDLRLAIAGMDYDMRMDLLNRQGDIDAEKARGEGYGRVISQVLNMFGGN
jgi:hypothetical protein